VAVPPVGGEAIAAVFFRRVINGDVIGAFELDDVRGEPGHAGIAAAFGVGEHDETEFAARVLQGVEIPDLGLDGGEVGHGLIGSWIVDGG
jgi:hypothetical protein